MTNRKEHNLKYRKAHAEEISAQKKGYNLIHAEERRAKAKAARAAWTHERREADLARKKAYNNSPEGIAKRKLYQLKLAEARKIKAAERQVTKKEDAKNMTAKVNKYMRTAKPAKVIDQPADTITLKEIAKDLGASVFLIREIVKEPAFNMPKVKMLRVDGIDLYDIYEIRAWMQTYKEALISRVILGTSKRKSGGITLTEDIMLLVNWVRNCAHIERYTMRLAQVSASKALCKSYGVKSLLEIKL